MSRPERSGAPETYSRSTWYTATSSGSSSTQKENGASVECQGAGVPRRRSPSLLFPVTPHRSSRVTVTVFRTMGAHAPSRLYISVLKARTPVFGLRMENSRLSGPANGTGCGTVLENDLPCRTAHLRALFRKMDSLSRSAEMGEMQVRSHEIPGSEGILGQEMKMAPRVWQVDNIGTAKR